MLAELVTTGVPAAIQGVAAWTAERRAKEAEEFADVIASGADILWAEDPRRAEVTPDQVRDAIVNGLAILAHRDGGVEFGGLHWHADPDRCRTCPGASAWSVPESADRGDRGAFFTPRELAEEIVANAIGPKITGGRHEEIASLCIADIACGSGAFLVAACRYLAGAIDAVWDDDDQEYFTDEFVADDARTAARLVAIECLYGVDVDPLSIEMANLALQLLVPAYGPVTNPIAHLRVGDALVGVGHPAHVPTKSYPPGVERFDWPEQFPGVFSYPADVACGFDVVVGNPPYLGGKKLSGAFGDAYREHLVKALAEGQRGSADLAVYFWLRAHDLANDVGVVAIVGPANLLKGVNSRVGQDLIVARGWKAYRIDPMRRWPSRSAAVSVCLVWTHRLTWVPDEYRDEPEDLRDGQFVRRITVEGKPYDIYRHPLRAQTGGQR